ncbi:MAG: hypothetical protein ACRD3W_17920, partial [Terriglobales bacterium]
MSFPQGAARIKLVLGARHMTHDHSTAEQIFVDGRTIESVPYLDFSFDPYKEPRSERELRLRSRLHYRLTELMAFDCLPSSMKLLCHDGTLMGECQKGKILKTIICLSVFRTRAELTEYLNKSPLDAFIIGTLALAERVS